MKIKNLLIISSLALLGLLGNIYNIEMFFGVNQIFGSIFVFLTLYYFGITAGVIVAVVVQAYTVYLWGHPYAFYSFVLEALVVGIFLKWRLKNIFIIDIFYWLFIGIWLVPLFYGQFMGLADNQVELIMLKQPSNGILNALLVQVMIIFITRFDLFQYFNTQNNSKDKITLHSLIFTIIMTTVAFSLYTTANLISTNTFKYFKNENVNTLTHIANHIEKEMDSFNKDIFDELIQLSNMHREESKVLTLKESDAFTHIWELKGDEFIPIAKNTSVNSVYPIEKASISHNKIFFHNQNIFISLTNANNSYLGLLKSSKFIELLKMQSLSPGIELYIQIKDELVPVEDKENSTKLKEYINNSEKIKINEQITHLLPSKKMPKMLRWKKSFYLYEMPISKACNYKILVKLGLGSSINKLQEIYIYTFYILLGIIIFAALISLIVTRSMFREIYRLSELTKNLPHKIEQNIDVEWPKSYIKEIMSLSNNFSNVTSLLQDIFSQSELKSKEHLKLITIVFQTTSEGIIVTDSNLNIIMVNKGFTQITGYEDHEVIGKKPDILQSGWQDNEYYEQVWESLNKKSKWSGEIWNRRKDGSLYAEFLNIYKVFDENNDVSNYIGVFIDITEKKKAQDQINQLAYYDILTNLPNRQLFHDRIEHAIDKAKRVNTRVAVMFIDLDNFKGINDTLGHFSGDILLKHIAKAIEKSTRKSDTIARLGGDEFTVIIEDLKDNENVTHLAESIIENISQPFMLSSKEIAPSASVGICFYPDDATSKDELLQFADTAMYRAKNNGKNRFEYYTSSMNEDALRTLEIESGLRDALANDKLELHYQPQVLENGKIIGCEALIRWNNNGKYVPPDEFIPIAENSILMQKIEDFVLKTAANMVKSWREKDYDLIMSVNISNSQFRKEDFVENLKATIDSVGVDYKYIDLELTERIVMDKDDSKLKLDKLNELGFKLSIDDFGTGQSSLSYLKRFDMDKLKIDKSFVDDIPNDTQSCDIAKAIVSLSSSMNMKSVAEGVETKEQLEFLVSLGCEYYQGYHFSKPLTSDDFEKLYVEKMGLKQE